MSVWKKSYIYNHSLVSVCLLRHIPIKHIRPVDRLDNRRHEEPPSSSVYSPAFDNRIKSDLIAGSIEPINTLFGLVGTSFSLAAPHSASGVLCFFWDLEATGLDVKQDDITQIACVCRRFHFCNEIEGENDLPDGPQHRGAIRQSGLLGRWEVVDGYPDKEFNRYVHTDRVVPQAVIEITGITNEFLHEYGTTIENGKALYSGVYMHILFAGVSFYQALLDWKDWIQSIRCAYRDCPVWFVAHNGNRYDLPLLLQQEATKLGQAPGTFLEVVRNLMEDF